MPPAELGGKNIRDHRGSVPNQPRVLNRIRGAPEKGMQVYPNQGSKQQMQMLYGGQRE